MKYMSLGCDLRPYLYLSHLGPGYHVPGPLDYALSNHDEISGTPMSLFTGAFEFQVTHRNFEIKPWVDLDNIDAYEYEIGGFKRVINQVKIQHSLFLYEDLTNIKEWENLMHRLSTFNELKNDPSLYFVYFSNSHDKYVYYQSFFEALNLIGFDTKRIIIFDENYTQNYKARADFGFTWIPWGDVSEFDIQFNLDKMKKNSLLVKDKLEALFLKGTKNDEI